MEPAARHDGDAVAEGIGLLHRMRREHHDAPLLGLLDDVPHATPVDRIHPGGGLVEVHDLRIGNQRASHREAAAHPTRVLFARLVAPVDQIDLREEGVDAPRELALGYARARRRLKMLIGGQLGPEDVVLRAEAHQALHAAAAGGTLLPKMKASPRVGLRMPESMLNVVVFPAPLCPSRQKS